MEDGVGLTSQQHSQAGRISSSPPRRVMSTWVTVEGLTTSRTPHYCLQRPPSPQCSIQTVYNTSAVVIRQTCTVSHPPSPIRFCPPAMQRLRRLTSPMPYRCSPQPPWNRHPLHLRALPLGCSTWWMCSPLSLLLYPLCHPSPHPRPHPRHLLTSTSAKVHPYNRNRSVDNCRDVAARVLFIMMICTIWTAVDREDRGSSRGFSALLYIDLNLGTVLPTDAQKTVSIIVSSLLRTLMLHCYIVTRYGGLEWCCVPKASHRRDTANNGFHFCQIY